MNRNDISILAFVFSLICFIITVVINADIRLELYHLKSYAITNHLAYYDKDDIFTWNDGTQSEPRPR